MIKMFDQPAQEQTLFPATPFIKEFPEEADIYLLNKNGTPTQRINIGRLENSQYWEGKYRLLGIILLVCFGYYVMTLLGETQIMEQAWKLIISFLGQFMPQIPKFF